MRDNAPRLRESPRFEASPAPTEEEAAAIAAAIVQLLDEEAAAAAMAQEAAVPAPSGRLSAWRLSGRDRVWGHVSFR